MANWYVSSVSYAAVTAWSAGGTMTVGTLRRPTAPSVGNERVYRCTTAGTGNVSGGSEPTWPLTKGSTVSDNGGVWTEVTGQEAYQGPVAGAWTAPFARLESAYASGWGGSSFSDTVFVSNAHSQTQATSWSPSMNLYTYCVTEANVPPTNANLSTGAVIAVSGDHGMAPIFSGYYNRPYVYGIKFQTGVGAGAVTSASRLTAPDNPHDGVIFEKCDFEHAATGALFPAILWSSTCMADFIDCTVKFGATGSCLQISNAAVRGNANTLLQGSTIPTLLISGGSGWSFLDGVDLSNVSTTIIDGQVNYGGGTVLFRHCKPHASATLFGGSMQGRNGVFEFINCDSSTTTRHERYTVGGKNVRSTAVVRTNGAVENSVPVSWKITTNSSAGFYNVPHRTFPLSIYNTTVGSSVNVTIEGIAGPTQFSALPKNDELWFNVGYNSDSGGSGQQTIVDGSKGSLLATASTVLSASTEAWDSAATARANSTAYSLGDIRKVASNPGRLFICTTAGTSSGSEPAGYASAVDGGSVTDGSATFKAMWRFKYTLAVTPQQVGYIDVYPFMAKASAVAYIDPLITLS